MIPSHNTHERLFYTILVQLLHVDFTSSQVIESMEFIIIAKLIMPHPGGCQRYICFYVPTSSCAGFREVGMDIYLYPFKIIYIVGHGLMGLF